MFGEAWRSGRSKGAVAQPATAIEGWPCFRKRHARSGARLCERAEARACALAFPLDDQVRRLASIRLLNDSGVDELADRMTGRFNSASLK